MDDIDRKILCCLKENARVKASVISEQISLSVSSVIERIRKLEQGGVITGYTVLLNQKELGNEMVALMEVRLEHPKYYDAFTQMVKDTPHIVSCYYLTGDFDFMLKIFTDSADGLELLHRRIKSMDGISATKTHLVLKTVKTDLAVIPD